ncbi:MAG: hypothetical protein QM763_03075 [Agriterribacter sp.]
MQVSRKTNIVGELWEKSVLRNFFPESMYRIVDKTHSDEVIRARQIESSYKPDLTLRDLSNDKIFYVECKYRSTVYNDKIVWTDYEHLKRYQIVNIKYPVFIALHLELNNSLYYLAPLTALTYPEIYKSVLKGYDRLLQPICSGDLWRLIK